MKKNILLTIVVAMAILVITAFKVTNAEGTDAGNKEEKSVAWFVANAKDARDQNKQCHDNPSIQSTPNCVNSLHALQISFAGGNRQR